MIYRQGKEKQRRLLKRRPMTGATGMPGSFDSLAEQVSSFQDLNGSLKFGNGNSLYP